MRKNNQAIDLRAALGERFGPILPASGHILTLKEPDETREEWSGAWTTGLMWPGRFYEKKPVERTARLLDAIRKGAKNANTIIIATDPDRGGQLIGDEILEFIGFKGKVLRAIYHAQDPKTIRKAFDNLEPNSKYHGLYMAGQAREQADQTVNLSLTRTATKVLKAPGETGAIGIGRVKTPVLGWRTVCGPQEVGMRLGGIGQNSDGGRRARHIRSIHVRSPASGQGRWGVIAPPALDHR